MEFNQYERYDVFAGTPALKVFRMLIAKATSHRDTEHGNRKVIAILDAAVAFFHADMDEWIYAHPPAEAEPDRTVVLLLLKAHHGTRKAARLWQEFLRNEVFMIAGWDAVAVEPKMYHEARSLNVDDDASVCVHGDDFMVKSRIDVFQDAKAMLEHKVDINVLAIIGLGQGTEAKIAKRNLSCSPSVQSKSKTRARSDHAGWIGTVESSSADTGYRCNDKDNVKRLGRVILGSC